LRTNSILDNILHVTQTGYVPGRQVNDNLRLIEEIIETAKSTKQESYLITLDATKAFDSVDHKYLQDILRKYGFPPEYINWVKILYTDLRANVLINGFKGSLINIERSVKQGDALSCALFVIAMDPLLRAIDKDNNIKPILIKGMPAEHSDSIKTATYADDITGLCQNKEGIEAIIRLYSKFSTYSGIELNVQKTEILVMGKCDDVKREFDVCANGRVHKLHDQDKVKICGITFSNDTNTSYKENRQTRRSTKRMETEESHVIWQSANC